MHFLFSLYSGFDLVPFSPRHCEGIHARGNLFPPFAKPCLAWGMVDSTWFRSPHVIARSEATWQSVSPLLRPFGRVGGWWIRFAFILPSAGRMNIGSHQFLNWWQQVSTGHLHLEGFESHHPHSKTKTPAVKAGVLFWWGMVDSNHRRHSQQIYSLSPLATREIPHIHFRSLEPVDGLEPPTC